MSSNYVSTVNKACWYPILVVFLLQNALCPQLPSTQDCHSPSIDGGTTPMDPRQLFQIAFGCPQIPWGEKKSSPSQINLEIAYIIFNYWEVKMHINMGFKKYL